MYFSNNSELKKAILKEFHAKPYSIHPRYENTLTMVKNFYYFLNLNNDVVEFVARFLDYQKAKVEYKHLGGLLQLIAIPE